MFGEHESESPRVPSPWDSLISSPRSLSPSKLASHTGSTIPAAERSKSASPQRLSISPLLLPRLVPENDSGNVEYKLQLLNPAPARFTRLVTQLKWRLLEGGGQAYYELGVADSGDLVGLGRDELESSLDTLEMMAGEIGASVIVVKEIEVPAGLAVRYEEDARNGGNVNSWGDARGKRSRRREQGLAMTDAEDVDDDGAAASTTPLSSATNTETEEECGIADDCDCEEMGTTVVLQRSMDSPVLDGSDSTSMFTMDLEAESDVAEAADISEIDEDKLALPPQMQYVVDLEISSVYKPLPMRKRFHHIHPGHHTGGSVRSGGKRAKKEKQYPHASHTRKGPSSSIEDASPPANKSSTRRQARDRRREERKQSLLTLAVQKAVQSSAQEPEEYTAISAQTGADTLVEELEALHVDVESNVPVTKITETTVLASPASKSTVTTVTDDTNATRLIAQSAAHHSAARTNAEVPRNGWSDEDEDDAEVFVSPAMPTFTYQSAEGGDKPEARLIVEVLVVRKMSIEEGFLDFEGFSFT